MRHIGGREFLGRAAFGIYEQNSFMDHLSVSKASALSIRAWHRTIRAGIPASAYTQDAGFENRNLSFKLFRSSCFLNYAAGFANFSTGI